MNYPRINYEMTEVDLKTLLDAMRPQPVMKIGDHWSGDTQESANRAWAVLGAKMGFDPMSCEPRPGMGNRFFTAIPSENETQRAERVARLAKDKTLAEIAELENEISERQAHVKKLRASVANHYPLSQVECRP